MCGKSTFHTQNDTDLANFRYTVNNKISFVLRAERILTQEHVIGNILLQRFPTVCLSSLFVNTITFERIIGCDCALAYFLNARKGMRSSLTRHFSNNFNFIHQKRFSRKKIQFPRQNIRDPKKMLRNKIVRFKKIKKFSPEYFSIGVISFLVFIKNAFIKTKIQFFWKNIQNTEKMLRNKIVYFENIYNFSPNHSFIAIYVLLINENDNWKYYEARGATAESCTLIFKCKCF